ncbi:MAG: nucleotide sugar dehydrogenase, partial [Thiohalomonadales bacterium]
CELNMKNKKIAVIGLGYVGLPLASLCAVKDYQVVGFESNQKVVNILANGKSHIVDKTVEDLLDKANKSGNFYPTADTEKLVDCSVYLICVPTPVNSNNDPDLKPLISALDVIAPYINDNDLIVVESTVFPGTCDDIVLPYLEAKTGKKVGVDFQLAHCPERVNPGDDFWTTENIPRVVGATTQIGVKAAADLYVSILGGELFDVRDIRKSLRPKIAINDSKSGYEIAQTPLGSVTMMHSIRDAEAVKAMENTVRDVNIAFVNELAKISDVLNLDVVDVIDGMSTKPFGKGPFFPGAGVGGHCIAVDPEWLKDAAKKAGYMPEIIQLARNTNNGMPGYAVSLLQNALNEKAYPVKGTAITILGVAYKKNVDDARESPYFEIKNILTQKGANLRIYDSWIKSENTAETLEQALKGSKAIFIVTDHDDCINQLKNMDLGNIGIKVVVDGRNCLDSETLTAQGVLYCGIGRR